MTMTRSLPNLFTSNRSISNSIEISNNNQSQMFAQQKFCDLKQKRTVHTPTSQQSVTWSWTPKTPGLSIILRPPLPTTWPNKILLFK